MDFSMVILIIIFISILGAFIYMCYHPNLYLGYEDIQKLKDRHEEQNVLEEAEIIHLSGHPYLREGDAIFFQIRNNNTIYFYKENVNTGIEIPISNLIKYEIKTESEIRHDVTLGRLLTLGIFAFGVKKKSKVEEQFLLLSYIQNKVEVNCIFKQSYDNQGLGDIISTINRLRIEENKGQIEEE